MTPTQSTDALEALRELVALEDLKKSLAQASHHASRFPTDENYATIDALQTDLARRRQPAWERARASLAAPQAQGVAVPEEQERARKLAEDWHEGVPKADQFAWACKAAGSLLLLSRAAPRAPQAVPAQVVEAMTDKIAEMLRGTFHCHRVWSAWQVGTMSEDDFSPVEESDTPREIAEAVAALAAQPSAPSAPAAPAQEPDMRKVCEALGFDPTNHHNAAKCPYCRPAAPLPQAPAAVNAQLLAALKVLVEEKADYMRRNHLGDPEREDATKLARAAIAAADKGIA